MVPPSPYEGADHHAPYKPETEQFMICPVCGWEIDMRNLGEVLHHASKRHRPLRYDDTGN
ncbi:hypothetical protein EN859_019595 [Mesorhizobium sp. M00.F.Ca.ET.216.01.1.1]|nr:hypothetical protein EN859_019595 [Mesorhizobium sp. M00.F.Ca.ET.216.01.1.1]TJW10903.1 MAG: hypothetical protein E5W82_18535 [Mesorhizobium sp.]